MTQTPHDIGSTMKRTSKRSSKPKKAKIPDSLCVWPCAILAVDPGDAAGAAIYVRGELIASRQCSPGMETLVVKLAVDAAALAKLPLIIVREKWTPGGHRGTPAMMAGLGMAWGRWDAALRALAPKAKQHQVYARTWQCKVISGKALKGPETIKVALQVAIAEGAKDPGPDESVAICIGRWASRAGKVGELLDLKLLEAHGHDTSVRRATNALKRIAKASRVAA